MAHILNGDMVTMTLMQGVLNTFVIFLSRILAQVISASLNKSDDTQGPSYMYFIITTVLEI